MRGISLPSASQAGLPPGGSSSSSASSSRREPQPSWGGRSISDCPHQQGSTRGAEILLAAVWVTVFWALSDCRLGGKSSSPGFNRGSPAHPSSCRADGGPPPVRFLGLFLSWFQTQNKGYVGRVCQPLLSSVARRAPP